MKASYFKRILLAMAWSAVVWGAPVPSAWAQFQLDIERLAEATYAEEEVEPKPQQQGNQRGGMNIAQNLDGWIFNRHGNKSGAQRYFDNHLKARLDFIHRECELDEDQIEKLRLAGHGDMASFFSDVEVIREEFRGVNDQNKINQVFQRIQPLQLRMQTGLFLPDSMLAKVTKNTLSADQQAAYQAMEEERIRFAYRAAIKVTLSELEKSMPLLAHQREELQELLEETEPPKAMGQQVSYFVLYRMSQIQDKIKARLNPAQKKSMRQAFTQGQAMRQFLKQNGFID